MREFLNPPAHFYERARYLLPAQRYLISTQRAKFAN
jgi:hypothetical protein